MVHFPKKTAQKENRGLLRTPGIAMRMRWYKELLMNLKINSRHVEVTPAMRTHLEAGLAKIRKHFDHVIDASAFLVVVLINLWWFEFFLLENGIIDQLPSVISKLLMSTVLGSTSFSF